MRVQVLSASASVRRTLEQVVAGAGHQPTHQPDEAELTLVDLLHHAGEGLPTGPILTLGQHGDIHCPVHPSSLIQRLAMHTQVQSIGLAHGWELDLQARSLKHPREEAVALTEKECQLLRQLASSGHTTIDRESLLEAVWGVADAVDTHTLETHIYRLRNKLDGLSPKACDILNESGGYRLLING